MESTSASRKRIRISKKPKACPNPLFVKWLRELKEEAARRESPLQHVYSRALKSLLKYPLPLRSGQECKVLQYFGTSLCDLIDKKLERHLATGGILDELEENSNPSQRKRSRSKEPVDSQPLEKPAKTSRREYVPARRSGAYAILIALIKNTDSSGYMTKAALQEAAQPYADSSFHRPKQGIHHTAWSSMKTLIDKSLVEKWGSPAKYKLTENGRALALRLIQADDGNQCSSQQTVASCSASAVSLLEEVRVDSAPLSSPSEDQFSLSPHEYEIVLCVDNAEIAGNKNSSQKQEVLRGLQETRVTYDTRKLSVGDYLWICRPKNASSSRELVLPFVVERKRFDDLASSIKDGRYKEQKFRLKNCGLSRAIYLVEEYGSRERLGLPEANLIQAITNTCVVEHFGIYWSSSPRSTVAFLHHMTKKIITMYQGLTVQSRSMDESVQSVGIEVKLVTFPVFNCNSGKQQDRTITEMFVRQLLQLHGVSADKAKAIIDVYPTVASLMQAYDQCRTQQEKEKLLASIRFGNGGRVIGPTISSTIALFYTQIDFRDL